MLSVPWLRKIIRGIRLIKNAVATAVLTCVEAQLGLRGFGCRAVNSGNIRVTSISMRVEDITKFVIAATWICTKSFWFLRPTDELLSFRSSSEPWSLTMGVGISSPYCFWPLSVDKRILTSIFRTTI